MRRIKELEGYILRLEYKVKTLEECNEKICDMFEQQGRINAKQDAINEEILGLINDMRNGE